MTSCLLCVNGWRDVPDGYAEREVPMPDLSLLPPDIAEIARAEVEHRRASASASVYPCSVCSPALFERWSGKHLSSKHDESICEECQEIRRGKQPSKRSLATPTPPERRDLL